MSIKEFTSSLSSRHRRALKWVEERTGQESPWPTPLILAGEIPTLLACRPKGIYKPKWSQYALSVRLAVEGPYPDRERVLRKDGTWKLAYFQENKDPHSRDSEYTNKGLLKCWRDRVPIGVMEQIRRKPRVRYLILGLALVSNWKDGYFLLEGFSASGLVHDPALSRKRR